MLSRQNNFLTPSLYSAAVRKKNQINKKEYVYFYKQWSVHFGLLQ